jgi:deazaflavin-dependent oxidoreductase (nitroreductase family)
MIDQLVEDSKSGWIAEHRKLYLEDGEAGHMWDSAPAGGPGLVPTLLLFTVGRKSGNESIMPLIYGEVDGGYSIIASKGGAPKHPGWYHNAMAQDQVQVKVGNDFYKATARVAKGDERARVWALMESIYPPYKDYQASAGSREIPVVIIERV